MASLLVKMRQTWQIGSDIGDEITISMDGYGVPIWIQFQQLSNVGGTLIMPIGYSVTTDDSIVYVSLFGISIAGASPTLSQSLGSIANTVSVPFQILALIASR